MTDEEIQAKKEFTKLKRSATLLGIPYTDETTFEELKPLVAEAKSKIHLEELQEQADTLGLEYPEDATAEQIEALLEQDRVTKEEKAKAEAEEKAKAEAEANTTLVAPLPANAHTYYVFREGTFIKFFTNEQFKGDAQKFAEEYAAEIGGNVIV